MSQKPLKFLTYIFISTVFLAACTLNPSPNNSSNGTQMEKIEETLIVLSVPSINDSYYSDNFDKIVDFQSNYANLILENGDDVALTIDSDTREVVGDRFPAGKLIEREVYDIWARDFSTVNPYNPVLFDYAPAAQGGDEFLAKEVQDSFVNNILNPAGISYKTTDLVLDGGNLVDNYNDKAIVTDRFLGDNNLSKSEAVKELKELLGVSKVAIVPNDDPDGLAHADGMIMFIEDNKIVVNKYEEPFRSMVINELETAFPGIEIFEVPVDFDETIWDPNFGSSCGINVNSVVTKDTIYMPVFGKSTDYDAINLIRANTNKRVVQVPAGDVCVMGGSVRCLSWQVVGENKDKIKSLIN